jgi:moderate conductance mechanosensitive channel
MDWAHILDSIDDFYNHVSVQLITTLVVAMLLQVILRMTIGRAVRKIVRRHKFANQIDEEKREKTLITIFRTAGTVILWVVVVVVVLWQLKVNLAALVTGAGLVGIVVGFGAQNAIKDFLAGIFVIAENQYRVGDIVTLRPGNMEISGVVEDITIRITRLRDLDGNVHIVQNGSAGAVTNLSFGYANVNVDVRVAYDSDINKVEKVMNEVGEDMTNDEKWAGAIVEPIQFLRVDGFEDSGVRVKALGKVEPAMQWDVAGEFRRRLKHEFEKHDISIPLPQVVVHQAAKHAKN